MHHPYDQRCKAVLAAAFESVAEAELERAVHVPPQRIDVAFEPKPGVRAPELGLLDRIVAEGPGMIEYYSHTVRATDVEECQRKRHSYTHERRLAAEGRKPADPLLWIVSMGRPRKALERYEAQVMEGWPAGCWRTREVDRTRFVVLNDLPETIETVLLRLLGRGRRFHRALAELMALPEEHPLVRRVRKVVVAFWDPIVQDLTRSGDMNALQKVESLYAAWEQRTLDEGRKEGIKEGRKEGIKEGQQELLLKLLTLKFGQLAEGVEQRVLAADAAALDRWAAQVLVADSLDDVFAEP